MADMNKKKGRPLKSEVRQNIVEILFLLGASHGYQIAKIYKQIYPNVTTRLIYYHLNKGLLTKEFEIANIKKESGDYSWGGEAEKIYYKLGKNAKPKIDEKVQLFLKSNQHLEKQI